MTDHDNRPAVPLREAIAPIVEACRPKPCTYDPQPDTTPIDELTDRADEWKP